MYKVIDLFAGAGGLSLGFEMTEKFKVVAFVENNKNASKTYLTNRSKIKNYDDIRKLNFQEVKEREKNIDVIIGGPPCQGFSNANRQRRKLINGSNELVKCYVEAIKELKPSVFVMENVKTIASNTHSFCLTKNDEDHIKNDLKLDIHNKDIILYEGDSNINELVEMSINHTFEQLILLDEDLLYILKNIVKKKGNLSNYFNKINNKKATKKIIQALISKYNFPVWFKNIIQQAHDSLQEVYDTKSVSEENNKRIMKFWDIQRLFFGLDELNRQNAIYNVRSNNKQIIIGMQTYIVIDFIKESFKFLGYKTNGNVLNAASFGVPQCRERYILIGVKDELIGNEDILMPEPLIEDVKNYVTVKKAISDLEKYDPTVVSMDETINRNYVPVINSFYRELVVQKDSNIIYNHVCTNTREIAKMRFAKIEQGQNFHSLPEELKDTYENPERTQNTIYKRLEYDKPSDTVVNVRKSMWIHPTKNRAISAREAARLQSFPDSYRFLGTKDSVYQQIGNAVPPLLGRAVAEVVLNLLGCEEDYEKMKEIFEEYV